jgi:SAM-dependent methyltransferase
VNDSRGNGTTGAFDAGMTVEELLDRVRSEIARRSRKHPLVAAGPPSIALAPEFQHLQVLLSHAERVADVGTKVPPFGLFGPLRRALARGMTRALYFFLQVISVDQRVYNGLILRVLKGLIAGLRQGETAFAARVDQLIAMVADVQARLDRIEADGATRVAEFEAALARHRRDVDAQVSRFQEDLGAVLAAGGLSDANAGRSADDSLPADLAGLYAAFEERFRGSRAAIVERVREYLPIVRAAAAGSADRPVLDLGCGRGEWLEVLREAGLRGRGVDNNPVLVEQCRGRDLEVAFGDVLAHLRAMPAASVGAVTAVHLVEHLRFAALVSLVDETVRVLKPGGVAIFETPNIYNLLVGACAFHTDPTHELPLAPEVLQFLAEARGLGRVEIRPLHRGTPLPPLSDDAPAALRRVAPYLDAPEDYAVIGYRT